MGKKSKKQRTVKCYACNGQGRAPSAWYSYACGKCHGRKYITVG